MKLELFICGLFTCSCDFWNGKRLLNPSSPPPGTREKLREAGAVGSEFFSVCLQVGPFETSLGQFTKPLEGWHACVDFWGGKGDDAFESILVDTAHHLDLLRSPRGCFGWRKSDLPKYRTSWMLWWIAICSVGGTSDPLDDIRQHYPAK